MPTVRTLPRLSSCIGGGRVSLEAMAIVLHHSRARGSAKVILLGIANHAGDGGSWPTVRTLAKYANCDRSTVQRAITRLRSLGEIHVDVQGGGTVDYDDELRPNRYDILLECPATCDRTMHHRTPGDAIIHTLWKNPAAVARPGRGGAAVARPGGGRTDAAQTNPLLTPTQGSALPTGHARDTTPPCKICSQSLNRCREQDARVPVDQRHEYDPATR